MTNGATQGLIPRPLMFVTHVNNLDANVGATISKVMNGIKIGRMKDSEVIITDGEVVEGYNKMGTDGKCGCQVELGHRQ